MKLGLELSLSASRGIWTPTDLGASVLSWGRADSVTTTGALVDQDNDLSGNANHGSAAGAVRPTLVSSDADYGGSPSMSFSGAQRLTTPAISTGPFTAIVVAKFTGAAGYIVVHNNAAGVNGSYLYGTINATSAVFRGGAVSAYNLAVNWATAVATPRVIIQRYDGTHAGETLRINGVNQATSSISAGEPGSGALSAAWQWFGLSASLHSTGTMAERVLINRSITDAECALFEAYARARYGLTF